MSKHRNRKKTAAKTVPSIQVRYVTRARYDAAQTNNDTYRLWMNADYLSGNGAGSMGVRRLIRSRARFEVENNGYAAGIISTIANDCIGTGPRLQLLAGDNDTEEDRRAKQFIEQEFAKWCIAANLSEKLRTAVSSKKMDGEVFVLPGENRQIAHRVKLDIRLIETDQVTTNDVYGDPNNVDGVIVNDFGVPVKYQILKQHPGDLIVTTQEFSTVSADLVMHYYKASRPGMVRGISEIAPALPLFAQLRRFTSATVDAAETAAKIPLVLETTAPADGSETTLLAPMDVIELERNLATALPEGTHLNQIKAEHPTTTYGMFKAELINEIARCLNMPYNVAACNSSSYNYSSGRLDHKVYFRSIDIEQNSIESIILDRLFKFWIAVAGQIPGYLPESFTDLLDIEHQWFWDGPADVDPVKEEKARGLRIQNGTSNRAIECAKLGVDWENVTRQRAKEIAFEKQLGIYQEPPTTRNADEDNEDGKQQQQE